MIGFPFNEGKKKKLENVTIFRAVAFLVDAVTSFRRGKRIPGSLGICFDAILRYNVISLYVPCQIKG